VKKILIVEDELILSRVYSLFLENQGFEVVKSESFGEKGAEFAINNQIDLVIMDIQLKGKLDGIDVAHKIREKKNIPIIFTTGNSMTGTRKMISGIDNVEFLSKPVHLDELKSLIIKLVPVGK